jgi:long-chain acyl-CoA synthetase
MLRHMAKFETLVEVFERSIKTYPDRELFGTKKNGEWRWSTYLEFGRAVDKFRAGLAGLGFARGDKLAIIANNRIEWAVAAYAAYGLGVSFVPMYEAQHPKEWEFILRDCEATGVVVATAAIASKVGSLHSELPHLAYIISLEGVSEEAASASSIQVTSFEKLSSIVAKHKSIQPYGDDLAGIIYTSGTTGNPKGVMLTHRNIASNVSAVHAAFGMTHEDRSLSFLPWAHVMGQTCELHTLFSLGASIALCESVDKILPNLAEVRPTLICSVPRIFNRIYASVQKQIASQPAPIQSMVKVAMAARRKEREGQRPGLSERLVTAITDKVVFAKVRARFGGRMRYAFSGGAAISPEVAEFIDGLGIVVYEGYGLTETSPIVAANCPAHRKIGTVGHALPGVRIEISPEGEIIVFGPNVMKGYYNRPEENAAAFTSDGGFRTGDLGSIEDGFLRITGRIKEQYKLENGKYVVPTPLEEQIKLSPYVANVMVYGDNRPFNVALLVPAMDTLRAWAQEHGLVEASASALMASPAVIELFKGELKTFSGKFKGFEEIRDFALAAEDFTTENGMLTPSLKVKRKSVLEVHGSALEALYRKRPESRTKADGIASQ